MTARVLVVDDIMANVKLLEAKLKAEYYDVVSAMSGEEALEAIKNEVPDIILLDVMMPGMDGFEVCERIRANRDTQHIPIVMVTALDAPEDRVRGLSAGADDFLTKPVNDIALFARVKSLVRIKMMTDELMMRQKTGEEMGLVDSEETRLPDEVSGRILIVEDREISAQRIAKAISPGNEVEIESNHEEALIKARSNDYGLIVTSLDLKSIDGLRFCSHLRTMEATRQTPILMVAEESDMKRLVRALDIGVNDYLLRPIDENELKTRVKALLKRKLFQDMMRQNLQLSLELAITDQLTGVYNRRYMETHLSGLVRKAKVNGKPLSMLMLDIDHFKNVNDSHGHAVGDEVLKEFAGRLQRNVRGLDLACRYGGEEFVVLMPETPPDFAMMVAERLRADVADLPFETESGELSITISIGMATLRTDGDTVSETGEAMLKRADEALYQAKGEGRNRVVVAAA